MDLRAHHSVLKLLQQPSSSSRTLKSSSLRIIPTGVWFAFSLFQLRDVSTAFLNRTLPAGWRVYMRAPLVKMASNHMFLVQTAVYSSMDSGKFKPYGQKRETKSSKNW
eukprot:3652946-Amphidinium_carterae.2